VCGTARIDQVFPALPNVGRGFTLDADALPLAAAPLDEGRLFTRRRVQSALRPGARPGSLGPNLRRHRSTRRAGPTDRRRGREGIEFANGFLLLTSRASGEAVQKGAMMGIPLIAPISAPTSVVTHRTQTSGVTLLVFARATSHDLHRMQIES
jgi:FdhD protein